MCYEQSRTFASTFDLIVKEKSQKTRFNQNHHEKTNNNNNNIEQLPIPLSILYEYIEIEDSAHLANCQARKRYFRRKHIVDQSRHFY